MDEQLINISSLFMCSKSKPVEQAEEKQHKWAFPQFDSN